MAVALRGSRAVNSLPDSVTLASAPVFRDGRLSGALLARAERPQEITQAIEALRGDRLTAAAVAIAVAIVIGFLIATAITSRVKRLADSAARITEGQLDEPLEGAGGRDEITELGNRAGDDAGRAAGDVRRPVAPSAIGCRRSSTRSTTG